jgi:Flp pilus assembly protein TadG
MISNLRRAVSWPNIRRALAELGRSNRGISAIETALVLPILLSVVFGTAELGIFFSRELAIINAVQSAARFAAVSPAAWSASPTADVNSIQGKLQLAGVGVVPNKDADISISYLDGLTGAPCGSYSQSSGGFVAVGGATLHNCVVQNNIVKVRVNYTYTFITPGLQMLSKVPFPKGIVISPTTTILLDASAP